MNTVKWNGSNVEEVKQLVENKALVFRSIDDENTLVLLTLKGLNTVKENDVIAVDSANRVGVIPSAFSFENETQSEQETSSSEDEDNTTNQLKGILKSFGLTDEHINKTVSTFNDVRTNLESGIGELSREIANRGAKAKDKFENEKDRTKEVFDELRQRYEETAQKEESLFNELKSNPKYSGLSDNELKVIVRRRIFNSRK